MILALHAWGADLGDAVARLRIHLKYRRTDQGPFSIYARRSSAYGEFAARTLDRFTQAMMQAYGGSLRLRRPEAPGSRVTVYLLESKEHLETFGFGGLPPDRMDLYFSPGGARFAIIVGEGEKQEERDGRALLHGMTHALLALAGEHASWSPWLSEGMATYFEHSALGESPLRLGGADPEDIADMQQILGTRDFLPLPELLSARESDFRGKWGKHLTREVQLLTAFLIECHHLEFLEYCQQELQPGPVSPQAFERSLGDPAALESEWIDWIRTHA
jgi:hypothetical protein